MANLKIIFIDTPQKSLETSQTPKKKKPMSIDALIKAINNTVVTELDKKRLNERLIKADEKFEKRARERRITEEFLQRRITI